MKTSYLRAVLAITLVAGFNLPADAGILRQDISPATRAGSSPLAGFSKAAPVIVVPMPAQILLIESQLLPQQLPQPLPLPAAVEDPATVPEPGALATLAAGLVLMGVLSRRRRPTPRRAPLNCRKPASPTGKTGARPRVRPQLFKTGVRP